MSLHRFIVPPPLALAVHPAPPSKPKPSDKDKPQDKEKKDDNSQNVVIKNGNAADPDHGKNDKQDDKIKPGPDVNQGKATPPPQPSSPATPGSMLPEPPTPVPGAPLTPLPADDAKIDHQGANVPAPNRRSQNKAVEDHPKSKEDKPATGDKAADNKADVEGADHEAEVKLEPLQLLAPAPPRPPRAKLDLNPSVPYPPINTDPRGAYHKYAKAFGAVADYHHIDLAKDGWLVPPWKERSEREALARLRGESELVLDREAQKAWDRRVGGRKVPETSEGVLLDLWNDLVEATNHELQVDLFWSRYDWTTPEARIHLLDVKRVVAEAEQANLEGMDVDADVGVDVGVDESAKETEELGPHDVRWTKEGVEEILGTVGIRCDYNFEKPVTKHWSEPTSAFLLLAHSHFLLRLDMAIQWQREKPTNEFQVLVVNHHDRVFGEMVKAQMAEERKKKEKEYKERKAREKQKEKDKENGKAEGEKDEDEGKDGNEQKDGVGKVADGEKEIVNKVKNLKLKDTPEIPDPVTPTSNRKVKDGDEVKPDNKEGGVIIRKDIAVVAVPVNDAKDKKVDGLGEKEEAKKRDEKHDADGEAVEVIVLNEAKGGGGAADGVKLDDIALAFKALELAQDKGVSGNAAVAIAHAEKREGKVADAEKDKDKEEKAEKKEVMEEKKEPLIWTWAERCEKWRWKNYEAGVHLIGPGGWEERDWKVFADDREVWDYDADEAEVEVEEKDIHDWSC